MRNKNVSSAAPCQTFGFDMKSEKKRFDCWFNEHFQKRTPISKVNL